VCVRRTDGADGASLLGSTRNLFELRRDGAVAEQEAVRQHDGLRSVAYVCVKERREQG
jgi:hypothetical protein